MRKTTFSMILDDWKYGIKVLVGFASGYEGLATKDGDQWQILETDWEDAYYVCLQFQNGRHLPLPIFDDWKYENDAGSLQKAAIKLSRYLFGSQFIKAQRQVKSYFSEKYTPQEQKHPDFQIGELSVRLDNAHPFVSIFLGAQVILYLNLKDWQAPCFKSIWHKGEWYGWILQFLCIEVLK